MIVDELPTKEIFPPPPPLVFMVTEPVKATGPVIEIAPFVVVVILPPIEIVPVPLL